MIRKKISLVSLLLVTSLSLLAQSNSYPTAGDVSIFNYSPLLVLQRNTDEGGFIQGVQTKFKNGTNNWYFGNLHSDSWIVSKGDYQNPKFTILQNGNVGIGTQNPSSKFEIYNTAQTGHLLLSANDNPNADGTRIDIDFKVANQGHTIGRIASFYEDSGSNGSGGLRFYTRNKGNLVENIRINSIGNVGIGTTSPAHKLDVIGTIRSREVKVDMNGADFVFEEKYPLMPLTELEAYVKKNKHLPEIAPAKEMQEQGSNLGDLNTKLLQKIEELTLYAIEQNKNLELQNKKLQLQNEKINHLELKLSTLEAKTTNSNK